MASLYNKELLLKKIPPNDIGINTIYDIHEQVKDIKKSAAIDKWVKITEIILENLYNKTKDLTLAAYLLEAMCETNNLDGALNGFEIILLIINNFPDAYSKDKPLIFDWINKNFSTWFKQFNLIKDKKFQDYYQEIYTQNYSNNITQISNIEVNIIDDNLLLIENILICINEINTHYSLIGVRENINYFKFYFKYIKKMYDDSLNKITPLVNNYHQEKESVYLKKSEIYEEITKIVKKYREVDKNDIILFLVEKVLQLSEKNNEELLGIVKEDALSGLYNLKNTF